MNKSILFFLTVFCLLIFSLSSYGQVGVGTEDPRGTFHVDGKKDNQTTITTEQQANDFIVTSDGDVGVGTIIPTAKLHVLGTARITNTPVSVNTEDKYVVVDAIGNLKSRVSPTVRISSLAEEGITDLTNATDESLYDFYFIENSHTVTLPKSNPVFEGRLLRFYIRGNGAPNVTFNKVYAPYDAANVMPSGWTYTGEGPSRNLHITGQANRFNFVDFLCDGGNWFPDNRN
ncbi:MAG: hypothetical protein ACK5MD_08530 [Flavobacteriales bacterium]